MAELTREEVVDYVKNRVSLEFANLRALDLRGVDFKKAKLSGADLSECRLGKCRFAEANLSKAKLQEADLTGADFTGANLNGADFQKAILVEANFTDTKLIGTSLRSADLSNAVMVHADLTNADLTRAKCPNLDLRDAVLTNAELSGAFMRGAVTRGANLAGVRTAGTVGLDINAITPGGPSIALDVPGGTPISAALGLINPSGGPTELAPRKLKPKGPKASKYHAELRRIPSVIFTPSGWIRGVFHVPIMHGFVEHLNLAGEFLKLTDVTLPYLKLDLKFFGIRRSKALVILPDCDVRILNLPQITAEYVVHRVSFLMEGGTVTGSLAIEEDIRLSDYLTTHDNYVVLKNCRFGAVDSKPDEESHFPYLLVNTACVIGASDEHLKQ